jgi:hypothetical protein
MKINLAGLAGNLAEMTNNSAFLHFIPVVRNPTNATNPNQRHKPSNKKTSPPTSQEFTAQGTGHFLCTLYK